MDPGSLQNSSLQLVDKNAKKNRYNFVGKKACITLSIATVVIAWILLLGPIVALIVRVSTSFGETGMYPGVSNLYTYLPQINNTNNYTNFTIKHVECVENFVYVSGEEMCYPSCLWSPLGDGVTWHIQISLAILDFVSLAFGSATLLVWILTSCIDWKKRRVHYDFQLPRTSLFMVLISSLLLILTNACIDSLSRSVLFCEKNIDGVPFLRSETAFTVSSDPSIRFITGVLGAFMMYFFAANLCWILFSLINILVLISFPNLRERFRKRIMVFAFQCFVSCGLTVIPVAITFGIGGESAYVASYIAYYIIIFNQWAFIVLFVVPSIVLPCLVVSLVVLIVAKMRINSFQSKEITGTPIKLTDLEKRLIGYSTFLMLLLFLYGIILVLFSHLTDGYFEFISQFIICVTVNSPIIATLNGTGDVNANNTIVLYRENPIGGVDTCRELEANALNELPFFIPILLMFHLRLVWTPIFIVIVPHISPKVVMNFVSRSRGTAATKSS